MVSIASMHINACVGLVLTRYWTKFKEIQGFSMLPYAQLSLVGDEVG